MSRPIDLTWSAAAVRATTGWAAADLAFPDGRRRVWISNDLIVNAKPRDVARRIEEAKAHVLELLQAGPSEAPIDDSLARAPENGPYSRLHLAVIHLVTVARHAATIFKSHPRGRDLAEALARVDAARKQ